MVKTDVRSTDFNTRSASMPTELNEHSPANSKYDRLRKLVDNLLVFRN